MKKQLEQHDGSEERVDDLEVPAEDAENVQGGLNFTKIKYDLRYSSNG